MSLVVAIEKQLSHMRLHADFCVNNEVFALFGASGSGKSMLLKCIAGLETPDQGRIVLNGRVLFDSARKIHVKPQLRKVGYVFQNYALFPNMTVKQNIGLAVPRNQREATVQDVIQRFRLQGLEDMKPSKLSGGQKQRVSIARMFAANPELILLDEPFSALDYSLAKELMHEMKGILCETKCPVILVSHNRDEVFELSSQLGVIEDGCLGRIRPTKEVFSNPMTIGEAKLCGFENILELSQNMQKVFQIDAMDENVTAIAIHSNDIYFHKPPSPYTISFSGRIKTIVEEIHQIRYQVLLDELPQCPVLIREYKRMKNGMDLMQIEDRVEVYVELDHIHFVTAGGNK